jgi:hypothetical protein
MLTGNAESVMERMVSQVQSNIPEPNHEEQERIEDKCVLTSIFY